MPDIIGFVKKQLNGSGRSATVKKNIFASFLIKGTSILISLMLVPVTIGYVSAELYGVWLSLSSMVHLMHFMDLGFSQGLKNKLVEAIANKDWNRGRALVSTTYMMVSLVFIPVCIVLEFILPLVNWCSLLNISEIYADDILQVLRVLVIFMCIHMIVNVLTNVVAAFQRVAFSSLFSMIGQVISFVIIFIMTKTISPSLMGLAFAYSAVPVLVFIVSSIILYSGRYKMIAPRLKMFDSALMKDLFNLGFKFFILNIQLVVIFQSTNILISHVSSPLQVTSYNIAYKYIHLAMMAYLIIVAPLWPAYSDAYVRQDYEWMRSMRNKMARILLLSIAAVVVMVLISPFVYHIWIGDKAHVPFLMTCLVAVYISLYCCMSLNGYLLSGMGKIQLYTYLAIGGMILHIPLSLFLGKIIGAYGVILSMSIITLVYAVVFNIQVNKILSNKAKGIWIR